MHRITTPRNPVQVETAISGVSTPSSVGEVRPADEAKASEWLDEARSELVQLPGRYIVEWVNPQGHDRWLGRVSGGISAESVVSLIDLLVRNEHASTFTVTKVG